MCLIQVYPFRFFPKCSKDPRSKQAQSARLENVCEKAAVRKGARVYGHNVFRFALDAHMLVRVRFNNVLNVTKRCHLHRGTRCEA